MPPEITIRLLTYNTHLMANSNLVVGAWIANQKPVVFQDEERHAFIVQKVKDSGADIVALQEVWAANRMAQIAEDLKRWYPHAAFGAEGQPFLTYSLDLIRKGVPTHAAGSGLVLLSKIPFGARNYGIFEGSHEQDEQSASKGYVRAVMMLPMAQGMKYSPHFGVAMTHAWTDAGGTELANIRQLIDGHGPSAGNMAFMGDFNIHRSNRDKYQKLAGIMKAAGAEDSWTMKHGTAKDAGSVTDDQSRNNLAQFFSPARNTQEPDCIDYVFVRAERNYEIAVADARVLDDWKFKTTATPKWYWIHEGTSLGMPSATVFGSNGEKVCVVARELDSVLRVGIGDRATNRWTSQRVTVNGREIATMGSPSVVWHEGKLHLFYRVGWDIHRLQSSDGITWTELREQPLKTSGGVCAVVIEGRLVLLVRDRGGKNPGEQIAYFVREGPQGWAGPKWVGIDTAHDISAAVIGNRMLVVAKDLHGHGVMGRYCTRQGAQEAHAYQLAADASTSGSPGVVAVDGNFEVFYPEKSDKSGRKNGGIFRRSSADGWLKAEFTYQATEEEVCAVRWGTQTVLFFPFVVDDACKHMSIDKVTNPEGAVLYPHRALAHSLFPPDLELDASDHYPYQVDLVLRER